MATYQILYWGKLPMRVRATDINGQKYAELPAKFMEAMNKASKQQGMEGTVMFRWSAPEEKEGTAEQVLSQVTRELDEMFPADVLLGNADD